MRFNSINSAFFGVSIILASLFFNPDANASGLSIQPSNSSSPANFSDPFPQGYTGTYASYNPGNSSGYVQRATPQNSYSNAGYSQQQPVYNTAQPYQQAASNRYSLRNSPVLRDAAIGAATGSIGSLFSGRRLIGRGIGVGAGTGVVQGVVSRTPYMQDRPYVRSAAQGAITGTGVGILQGRNIGRNAIIGSAGGLAVQSISNWFSKR